METWQMLVLGVLALVLIVSIVQIVRILHSMRRPTSSAPAQWRPVTRAEANRSASDTSESSTADADEEPSHAVADHVVDESGATPHRAAD